MSTTTDHALDALVFARAAARHLHDAAAAMTDLATEVARDIDSGDGRFIGARVAADTAWDVTTGKALDAIARVRAGLSQAETAYRASEQAEDPA